MLTMVYGIWKSEKNRMYMLEEVRFKGQVKNKYLKNCSGT